MTINGLNIYQKDIELFGSKVIMGTRQLSAHLQHNLETVSEFVLPEYFMSGGVNILLYTNQLYLLLFASAI